MQTAGNIISVLALFSFERPEWTVDEVAQELQLGRSTAYRYFKVLAEAGLVIAFRPGCYILGPAITQLDRQMRLLDPLIASVRGEACEMVEALPKPAVVIVCRLYRDQVMCIHQEPAGAQGLTVSYERGKLMSLHRGAASKVILAHLPARFVKSYCGRHGPQMAETGLGADWQQVRTALRVIRNNGLAVTHGEYDPGVTGVAAPLFDPDGNAIGSMSAVVRDDLSEGAFKSVCELVKTGTQTANADFVGQALNDEDPAS